jgi:hypothetical protein
MTPKEKYIGAFLDGYFADKNFPHYNLHYIQALEEAEKKAKKKWKQYKKQKL